MIMIRITMGRGTISRGALGKNDECSIIRKTKGLTIKYRETCDLIISESSSG